MTGTTNQAPASDYSLETEAAFEAEFLARLLEHPDTPAEFVDITRFLLVVSCDKIREHLQDNNPDPQLIRALYPQARRACPEQMREAFNIVFAEAAEEAPGVVNSIQREAEAS